MSLLLEIKLKRNLRMCKIDLRGRLGSRDVDHIVVTGVIESYAIVIVERPR